MQSKSSSGLTVPLKIHLKVSTFCTFRFDNLKEVVAASDDDDDNDDDDDEPCPL